MESKYDIIKFGYEDVEAIRKECNMDTEEKREEAFRILEEWLLKQDHLIKKTYSRDYLERYILTCHGSIEKTKLLIDRICTMRTLQPKYFQISDLKNAKLLEFSKSLFSMSSKLTKERYRVVALKTKSNRDINSEDFERLFKFLAFAAEFVKNNDVSRGFICIADILESNVSDLVTNFNLFEFQQFFPILTEGFGIKLKKIIFVTSSKLIEGFIKMIKPIFKEKMRNRIHVATTRDCLKSIIPDDIEYLPVEYGGKEKPFEEMHDDLIATLCSKPVEELLKKMNMARTDESRRQTDKFNDKYMGMAGTFRTFSLD